MKISKIIANTGEWLSGDGPHRQIVVTSRVRLARNIKGKPFPGWAKKAERIEAGRNDEERITRRCCPSERVHLGVRSGNVHRQAIATGRRRECGDPGKNDRTGDDGRERDAG